MPYEPGQNVPEVLLVKIVLMRKAHTSQEMFLGHVSKWMVDLRLTLKEKQALYNAVHQSPHAYQLFTTREMMDLWRICDMDKIATIPKVPPPGTLRTTTGRPVPQYRT